MQQITKSLDNKIKIILILLFFSFSVIIFRLFYLQIYLADVLTNLSTKNYTRFQKISSLRGNITDTNGIPLATNRPVTNIYWQGTNRKQLDDQQILTLEQLAEILNQDFLEPEILKKIKVTEKYGKTLLLAADASFEQLSKISEQCNSNNIEIETKFKRHYPQKNIASHLVGYLSQMDIEAIGKMGIEKLFEDLLKGEDGKLQATINSLGKHLSTLEVKQPIQGQNIRTTIDLNLQKIAENVFPEEYAGALIIMDPENGALRTIVSRPNFDPSKFLKTLSLQEWQEFQEKQPFLNRAFNACYPPASIFKLVTISAALEMDLITEHSEWYCKGHVMFAGRKYNCQRRCGHGLLSTSEAIAQSCNIPFYTLGKKISIDKLADYAFRFGLGKKTGIIFSEKEGLVPTSQWKIRTKGESWWPGETLSAVIGQSYLLVTPIQIACLVSSIFEGNLVKPRLLENEEIVKQRLEIRPDTLRILRDSMKIVVTLGTGKRINKIKDITVYAKTGTAQTSSLEKRELGKEHLEHVWFVSNFAYKNNKPLTLVAIIENAGRTAIVTNTVKRFLIEYRKYMEKNLLN